MICRACGEDKPEHAFQWNGDPVTRNLVWSRICRACRHPVYSTTVDGAAGTLRCSGCREWLPPERFPAAGPSRADRPSLQARGGRDYYCAACKREHAGRYYRDHAATLVRKNQQRRQRAGHRWRGSGRPHPHRRYIPAPGDVVRVDCSPSVRGYIAAVDPVAYTAKIKTTYGLLTYRWPEFRLVARYPVRQPLAAGAGSGETR
jgi:ribosomal protein L44E